MPELCESLRDALPDVVRGEGSLAPTLTSHAASCDECRRALEGARALGQRLGTWSSPEPAQDLVARTLARVRLAEALAPREPSQRLQVLAGGAPPPAPVVTDTPELLERAHGRRSSVELLATWALPGPRPEVAATARPRLGLRLAIQAAAAVVLVALCTGFGVTFYPAIVEALEERHHLACQKHLERIGQALVRYRQDHPDSAQDPSGTYALRDALVKGGYAREADFVCPAAHAPSGAISYVLRLPSVEKSPGRAILARDRLGNHGDETNVLQADGKVEHLDERELEKRLAGGN